MRWPLLHRRRRKHGAPPQPERERRPPERNHPARRAALPFVAAPFFFLAMQGLLACAGSLDLVIPDLPLPVPFQVGRAIHLNLSILWPLFGGVGLIYHFFAREAEKDLAWPGLAAGQFWLFLLTCTGILAALTLGFTEGREYLEAPRLFDLGLALVAGITVAVLLRTYFRPGVPRGRPALLALLTGSLTLLLYFLPNLFTYGHPTADEMVKFWVVHLWEEDSLELVATAAAAVMLMDISGEARRWVEPLLWLDITLAVSTGLLSTGHHYYWIGTPLFWRWVGGIFSGLQVIPIGILLWNSLRGLRQRGWETASPPARLALFLLGSSVFYHVIGAGMLGLVMAIPQFSRYAHGTYLTSAHAHMALFGAFGLLVLAGSYHILTEAFPPSKAELRWSWRGAWLINAGLLVMSAALTAAGFLQTYLWRMEGEDFTRVGQIIRPYLLVRSGGGAIFALGGLLLGGTVALLAWRERYALLLAALPCPGWIKKFRPTRGGSGKV